MKRAYSLVGLSALLLALAACAKSGDAASSKSPAVATVNGHTISAANFDAYVSAVARKPAAEIPADQKQQLLDQYISMQLAAEVAEKDGLQKTPDVEAQLGLARVNVLTDALLKKYLDEHPISDADLKAEYDTQVAAMPREYHARHILVESKPIADSIIRELKNGGDFAKLAEKESKDESGKNGGDLGWFTLQTMVKPFSDAVSTLEKGKFTEEPVQSQFGWHVIKLEDTRIPTAPAFDEVKDRVKAIVQRKRLQAYMDDLKKNAKIEKNLPADTPAPAASTPTAAK